MTGISGRIPARPAPRGDLAPPAPATVWALQVIAAGVILAILYWARIVFITATAAVILALILEPFVSLLSRLRLPRALSTFIVCLVALLLLYFAALMAWTQISTIVRDAPALRQNLSTLIESVSVRIQRIEGSFAGLLNAGRKPAVPTLPAGPPAPPTRKNRRAAPATEPVPVPEQAPGFIPEVRIHEDNPVTNLIYAQLGTLYQYLVMASFVPLLVFFMLSWRDHVYLSFLRFFDGPARVTAARSVQGIAGMARAFVVGNFLIGLVLTALTCSFFALIHLPYPFLSGVLSGLVSLVPYAGILLALLPRSSPPSPPARPAPSSCSPCSSPSPCTCSP